MEYNFDRAFRETLVHEGGWADHPKDPGGATMKGVTIGTYSDFLGRPATKAELRAIPDGHLQMIYREGYWDKVRADELPSGVDFAVYDAAVNSGPARAVKWLQQAVGAKQDGIVGPATIKAAANANPSTTVRRIKEIRLSFLKGLKTWPTFGKGWERRVNAVHDVALFMADQPPPAQASAVGGSFWSRFFANFKRLLGG